MNKYPDLIFLPTSHLLLGLLHCKANGKRKGECTHLYQPASQSREQGGEGMAVDEDRGGKPTIPGPRGRSKTPAGPFILSPLAIRIPTRAIRQKVFGAHSLYLPCYLLSRWQDYKFLLPDSQSCLSSGLFLDLVVQLFLLCCRMAYILPGNSLFALVSKSSFLYLESNRTIQTPKAGKTGRPLQPGSRWILWIGCGRARKPRA